MHSKIVSASILSGNHAALGQSAQKVVQAGCSWLHLDIMDGHFVPNLTFGPQMLSDLRPFVPNIFFDTHLMLDEPQRYIDAFIDHGAQNITVHAEPSYPILETLRAVRGRGCQVGIAIKPQTSAEALQPFLSEVDLILVMTVEPGFGGQPFMPNMIAKIQKIAQWRHSNSLKYRIQVDGGVDDKTWLACHKAGADTFVMGSAFYHSSDPRKLRMEIEA